MKKIVNIDGINCGKCASKIEEALYSLPQVDEVKVDIVNKNAEVEFISEIDNETLTETIENAGHFLVTSIESK